MEFSGVYDWICNVCESRRSAKCKVQSFKQIVLLDNPFSLELCAHYEKGQVSLSFRLLKIGSMHHSVIADLERTLDIHKRREDSIQHNLLPLSSLLFWGLFSPLSPNSEDVELSGVLRFSFLQSLLAIEGGIIEPPKYKQLFSSLVSATGSSFASYIKEFGLSNDVPDMWSSCSEILAQAQQKTLSLIGPAATHRFMYLWASRFTAESTARSIRCPKKFTAGFSAEFTAGFIAELTAGFTAESTAESTGGSTAESTGGSTAESLRCRKEYPSMLSFSYNTNKGGFWRISSYSPLISMETSSESQILGESRLQRALSYHMLHCIFQFGHDVKFCPDWIEVCLEMDNVRCDVCGLDPMYLDSKSIGAFPNERHFPAKICLTIGPENGRGVHSVSLTLSSHNPATETSKTNSYEAKVQLPRKVGIKASTKTSTSETMNNWGFEQSVVNYSDAKIDWTLYDSTSGRAVFNSGPPKFSVLGPKTWFVDRYSMASRAFTEGGGVVFAKDNFGNPITWRLNRDLEGQTLKWIVKGSVWLTYWPNAYYTRYSETRRHDFCQELDLTLPKSSASTSN